MMTAAAMKAIASCDVIVGYTGYVEQVLDLAVGKPVVSMPIGDEIERASRAIELARQGKIVAVVSSGDAGIYGMAAPVFQTLASTGWSGRDPLVEVVPGVTAMQAAASVLGAPLMQDFCAISLSDLLTPWDVIRKRVALAAEGDFVIAFYNPRSRAREGHLRHALDIISKHRGPQTPVGIVRNALREGQESRIVTLGDVDDWYDSVDMFTSVIVGNSTTFAIEGCMVTPRGYESRLPARSEPSP
jgi:precorrin-3B C17-methyltransferase